MFRWDCCMLEFSSVRMLTVKLEYFKAKYVFIFDSVWMLKLTNGFCIIMINVIVLISELYSFWLWFYGLPYTSQTKKSTHFYVILLKLMFSFFCLFSKIDTVFPNSYVLSQLWKYYRMLYIHVFLLQVYYFPSLIELHIV